MATPSFGGTNGVPELDIGQVGSARRAAGTLNATVRVLAGAPETGVAKTELVEQHVNFIDNLGITGRPLVWDCTVRASSNAWMNTLLGELEGYKSGKNSVAGGSPDPSLMHRTRMIDPWSRTYQAVKLADFQLTGPRHVSADWAAVQQMQLIFEELGDIE